MIDYSFFQRTLLPYIDNRHRCEFPTTLTETDKHIFFIVREPKKMNVLDTNVTKIGRRISKLISLVFIPAKN